MIHWNDSIAFLYGVGTVFVCAGWFGIEVLKDDSDYGVSTTLGGIGFTCWLVALGAFILKGLWLVWRA